MRGDWVPPRLTYGAIQVVIWTLALHSIFRAIDYLFRDDWSQSTLATIERALPAYVWAAFLGAGGLLLLGGMLLRRWVPVLLGHAILGVVYTVHCVGIFIEVLVSGQYARVFTSVTFAVVAVIHILYWFRNVAVLGEYEREANQ